MAPATPSPLVLVVDDDPDGRNLYTYALREAGFRVEEASDGFEAVDKSYKLKPRVILMDLLMPRLDGWEVVSWLKKNPITNDKATPRVIMTPAINRTMMNRRDASRQCRRTRTDNL